MIYKKGISTRLSTNFNSLEFDCPCDSCHQTIIDPVLVSHLEAMRTIHGSKLRITSGYRCQEYQDQLTLRGFQTAIGVSTHTLGQAVDVTDGVTPGTELEDSASKAGFQAIGVGKQWVHVDLREGKVRRWTYPY